MTRSQALTVGVLAGLVVLIFTVLIVVVFFAPFDRLFPPTSTPNLPPPTITPTPTFPNFLPTASLITPFVEPTATNTRVPTATPPPPRTPTPTVVFELPTPFVRPTVTPVPVATTGPTLTVIPVGPSPTFVPRQYRITFDADETEIEEGECTDLKWDVEGAIVIRLDGRPVDPSGEREVCPKRDTTYSLTIQLPDSPNLQTKRVTIAVEANANDNKNNNDNEDGN